MTETQHTEIQGIIKVLRLQRDCLEHAIDAGEDQWSDRGWATITVRYCEINGALQMVCNMRPNYKTALIALLPLKHRTVELLETLKANWPTEHPLHPMLDESDPIHTYENTR